MVNLSSDARNQILRGYLQGQEQVVKGEFCVCGPGPSTNCVLIPGGHNAEDRCA